MNSFNGLSSETPRPDPWQNLHIDSFAQFSVEVVECGGLGEEVIPAWWTGDDLRKRTASCCKRNDDFVSPALARFSGAVRGLLSKPTGTALHETHRNLARSMWTNATLTSYLATSLSR